MNSYMNFKAFRKDVNAALEEVAKKYGITLTAGNITYDTNSFTMKVSGKRSDVDVDRLAFEQKVVYMTGLTADDYLRSVKINNKDFTIVGLKPGNKYSVLCERSDGKTYAFVLGTVLLALGRN